MPKPQIKIYENAIGIKANNRRINVVSRKSMDDNIDGIEIQIQSLTRDTTNKKGVKSFISDNGKVKYSFMGLSNDAAIELCVALSYYIKQVMKIDNCNENLNVTKK